MQAAFSLIECLIVLAILTILAGLVYPSYQYHTAKVRRYHAELVLWEMAHRAEEHFVQTGRYDGVGLSQLLKSDADTRFYQFQIIRQSARDYLFTATPKHAQELGYFLDCSVMTMTPQGISCISK
jgi:prepilin-type N-terminal cleavage/methylation domain-containing protein